MSEAKIKMLAVSVPVHYKVKLAASQQGKPIQHWVEEALKAALDREQGQAA